MASNQASRQRHPLQRLSSPSRGISAVLHILGLVSFLRSFQFLVNFPNAISEAFGWHLQFLTIIGLSLTTLTFTLGLLSDLTLSTRLFTLKNAFSIVSTPLEVVISVLYWSLMAIDPSLLMPPDFPRLPTSADIGFHLAPAVFLVIDLLLLSPPWTLKGLPSLGVSSIVAVGYWFWVEECHRRNGFYPYPILDVATPIRLSIFAGASLIMAAATFGLRRLYAWINGVDEESMRAPTEPGRKKRS